MPAGVLMVNLRNILLVLLIAQTANCSWQIEPGISRSASIEQERAAVALRAYLDLLGEGKYEQATALYGGSYNLLNDYNPEIPLGDRAALLEAACEVNGFQCLPVREVVAIERVSPTDFAVSVRLTGEDGRMFVRGPCCGQPDSDSGDQSVFEFRVSRNPQGLFQVMDLPVYVP